MSTYGNRMLNNRAEFYLKRLIWMLCFILPLLNRPAAYSEIVPPGPARAAASETAAAFQSALDALQQEYGFPGATAACVRRDGTSAVAAAGVADRETGAPMTVRARMLAASIGKSFVAATVLALVSEGRLALDVPVSKWLGDRPWFSRLPNQRDITLRHLLTHSAGLPDHVHSERFAAAVRRRRPVENNPFTPPDLIGFVVDRPPLFAAGKGWAYTDTGYILIGLVIEAVIQRDCFAEIKARFLTPQRLTLTTAADRRALPGLVAGYTTRDNAFGFPSKTTTAAGVLAWHPGLEWTGGGLVSNALDLARWGAALFGGNAMPGDYRIDLLDSIPIGPEPADIQYGAGIAVCRGGPFGPVYGHRGWIPGYTSSLQYYADHGITIAFQINTDIGMLDESRPIIKNMETRLAAVLVTAARRSASDGLH